MSEVLYRRIELGDGHVKYDPIPECEVRTATPVCDLCDAELMCAACGHQQRPGAAQARQEPPLAKLLKEVDPGLADILTDNASYVALIRNNVVTACANIAAGHNGVSPRDARDIAAKIRALAIPSASRATPCDGADDLQHLDGMFDDRERG